MFTEEFQVEYYRTINGCLDERRFVVGEWPWNFADFSTQQGPMRVGSCNRKGLFTRERTPSWPPTTSVTAGAKGTERPVSTTPEMKKPAVHRNSGLFHDYFRFGLS